MITLNQFKRHQHKQRETVITLCFAKSFDNKSLVQIDRLTQSVSTLVHYLYSAKLRMLHICCEYRNVARSVYTH